MEKKRASRSARLRYTYIIYTYITSCLVLSRIHRDLRVSVYTCMCICVCVCVCIRTLWRRPPKRQPPPLPPPQTAIINQRICWVNSSLLCINTYIYIYAHTHSLSLSVARIALVLFHSATQLHRRRIISPDRSLRPHIHVYNNIIYYK